jgi:hypothetical protein
VRPPSKQGCERCGATRIGQAIDSFVVAIAELHLDEPSSLEKDIAIFQQLPHWAWGAVTKVTLPLETLPRQHNSDAVRYGRHGDFYFRGPILSFMPLTLWRCSLFICASSRRSNWFRGGEVT